jgi:hypothetical protein
MEIAKRRIEGELNENPAPVAASLILFIALFALLLAAATGGLGGGPYRSEIIESESVRIEIALPKVLRTGEFFELRASLTAKQPIVRPTLALGAGLLRNATINSFYPSAEKEGSTDEEFSFEFGRLRAGEKRRIKIDGQINDNMTRALRGPLIVRDGERELARVELVIGVLP